MSTDGGEQIIEMHVTEIELMQCALTGQRWHEERPIVTGTTARPQLILTTNKWSSLRRFTMVSRCPRGQLITLELTSIAVDGVPGGNEANTVSETEHFKIDYINKQGLDVQISGNNENSSILWIQLESANRMCVATRGENYSLLERKKCINGIFIWQLSHKLSHPYISLSRKMMIWLSQKMTKESTREKKR